MKEKLFFEGMKEVGEGGADLFGFLIKNKIKSTKFSKFNF